MLKILKESILKKELKCLYCKREATNKEHVPSKCLLEKPYPNNLITFPACDICNKSFSLDEEYFLNALATLSESQTLVARTQPGGSIYKARERNDRLYNRILDSIIQEDDGRTYFKIEGNRIKKIIEKYAFGLFYFNIKKKRL